MYRCTIHVKYKLDIIATNGKAFILSVIKELTTKWLGQGKPSHALTSSSAHSPGPGSTRARSPFKAREAGKCEGGAEGQLAKEGLAPWRNEKEGLRTEEGITFSIWSSTQINVCF